MLSSAQIGFRPTNFRAANDRLIFTDTEKIVGSYDETNGVLTLTGAATVEEYVQAVRTVNYSFINFKGIADETKTVYFTLSDGKAQSEAKERSVKLVYNFEELEIPSAFTPDGNGRNDKWEIKAGTAGGDKYDKAVIKIYNGRGMLVYETTGLSNSWDGMLNGSTLPADTYYYTIDLKYNNIRYKGIVTILR
jgi:gliding motility-associated-like protein